MAVRTRIDPISRDIDLILSEELGPEGRSKALASFAREQLSEAQAANQAVLGRAPSYQSFVDGQASASLDQVKPDGTIVFEFELVSDLIEWVELQLIKHSPERSGRYSKSHVLLADGAEVQFGATIPDASEYVFVNTQPYARKIEGTGGRPPQSKKAPQGVYQVVSVLASRRFGNIAKIRYGYRTPLFGAVDSWAGTGSAKAWAHAHGRRKDKAEWLRRQPAIIITL